MLAHVYFAKWQQFLRHFTGYPEIILGQLDAEGHFELKAGNMSRDKASHPHHFRTMIRCHETSRKCWNHIVHCRTMQGIFFNMKYPSRRTHQSNAASGFCSTAQSCTTFFLCMTLNGELHPFLVQCVNWYWKRVCIPPRTWPTVTCGLPLFANNIDSSVLLP